MAAVYGIAIDFRAADLHRRASSARGQGKHVEAVKRRFRLTLAPDTTRKSRRLIEAESWFDALNPLDPLIHRSVFQLWRSVALANDGYMEEAVTALDGLVAVATEAVGLWCRLATPSRSDVAACLQLDADDSARIKHLYDLRCFFGAHPASAKWWDFGEVYEDELEELSELGRRLLWRLTLLERASRRIPPDPWPWSEWLSEHAETVLRGGVVHAHPSRPRCRPIGSGLRLGLARHGREHASWARSLIKQVEERPDALVFARVDRQLGRQPDGFLGGRRRGSRNLAFAHVVLRRPLCVVSATIHDSWRGRSGGLRIPWGRLGKCSSAPVTIRPVIS
jgi:hypothetical protein